MPGITDRVSSGSSEAIDRLNVEEFFCRERAACLKSSERNTSRQSSHLSRDDAPLDLKQSTWC